ncbi:ABC transporter permease (plasmid) [Novosphingobium sp. P6W]|nr:ABC transporter permease [Novosphingobium sp. P6W]
MPTSDQPTNGGPAGDRAERVLPLKGLKAQARIVWALLLREIITRFGRRNIGFLWLFVEPAMFVIVITAIWTATHDLHRSQIPIAAFTLTGYTSMLMWRNTPSRCIGALSSNQSLLYHRQVTMLDIYLARIILEFAGVTTSFMVLGLLMWMGGWLEPPENVLQVIGGWGLLAWFGMALALTLGPLSERYPAVQKLWSPIAILLFILSGTSFLLDTFPPTVRYWLLWLPMTSGLEYLREGFFGSQFKAHYDLEYMCTATMVLMLFGLTQVRRVALNETIIA